MFVCPEFDHACQVASWYLPLQFGVKEKKNETLKTTDGQLDLII